MLLILLSVPSAMLEGQPPRSRGCPNPGVANQGGIKDRGCEGIRGLPSSVSDMKMWPPPAFHPPAPLLTGGPKPGLTTVSFYRTILHRFEEKVVPTASRRLQRLFLPHSVSRLEPSRDALSNDLWRISKPTRAYKHGACHFCDASTRGAAACICRSAKMPADLFCQSGVRRGGWWYECECVLQDVVRISWPCRRSDPKGPLVFNRSQSGAEMIVQSSFKTAKTPWGGRGTTAARRGSPQNKLGSSSANSASQRHCNSAVAPPPKPPQPVMRIKL